MRILTGAGVGLAIGLLFLIQVLGWASWCPDAVFMVLHFPSLIIAEAAFPGEAGFWGSLPFVPVMQWTSLGALVGVVRHWGHRSRTPANESRQPTAAGGSDSELSRWYEHGPD